MGFFSSDKKVTNKQYVTNNTNAADNGGAIVGGNYTMETVNDDIVKSAMDTVTDGVKANRDTLTAVSGMQGMVMDQFIDETGKINRDSLHLGETAIDAMSETSWEMGKTARDALNFGRDSLGFGRDMAYESFDAVNDSSRNALNFGRDAMDTAAGANRDALDFGRRSLDTVADFGGSILDTMKKSGQTALENTNETARRAIEFTERAYATANQKQTPLDYNEAVKWIAGAGALVGLALFWSRRAA